MSGSFDIGDMGDLADGEMRAIPDVGRYGVVVCRVAGSLHALEDNCSHADTRLSTGRLRGTTLTCPLHGAQFDVRDGSHSGPPAFTGVPCHRVEESVDGVVVHIEPTDPADGYGEPGAAFRTR